MHSIINGFAAAAVLIAAPAFADSRSGTPTPAATASVSEGGVVKEKRYCVVQSLTGSLLPKKTCKTRAQWMNDDDFDPLARK